MAYSPEVVTDPLTQALETQVGGHAGVMTTEDGSLLIKPALHLELDLAKFIGVLRLEGALSDLGKIGEDILLESIEGQKESIVLENLSYTFWKPNILDIKLGTVLYGPDASPEKVERMKKTAANTTSLETGVRLTGFQVHDNATGLAEYTPKSYGKSLKANQLGEGIARFFPVGDAASKGLPKETLIPILQGIREEVQEIRNIFTEIEVRMAGASLLVIYEADWAKAKEGLDCSEDGEDDDEDDEQPGPPFVVKVIDFAHTTQTPGQVDSGVLVGLDTVLRLLDGRLGEIN